MEKMSELIAEITDKNFSDAIKTGVVLVDFWAPWCPPCRRQAPVLETIAQSIGGSARIAKINIDENTAAAQGNGVQSIPTLILFKDGAEVQRFVGFTEAEVLLDAIAQAGNSKK